MTRAIGLSWGRAVWLLALAALVAAPLRAAPTAVSAASTVAAAAAVPPSHSLPLALQESLYFAVIGAANVTGTFVTLATPRASADHYLQLGFAAAAGPLPPGSDTGQIQNRFGNRDFSNLTQTGSWSFDPTKTALADWTKVTVYVKGQLVWGTEPT